MKLLRYIHSYFQNRTIAKQGGEKTSQLLRELTYKDHNVQVGLYSYGGCFLNDFNIGGKVIVGRYCSFGQNIHYYGANHPIDYASCSPYFYQQTWAESVNNKIEVKDVVRNTLIIGNDCWIGSGVIITSGCKKIGNGAIVAAGSVVTKDVEPYQIVGGVPAKCIRMRFDRNVIELLEKSKWYELEPDVLLNYYNVIHEPAIFAKTIIRNEIL